MAFSSRSIDSLIILGILMTLSSAALLNQSPSRLVAEDPVDKELRNYGYEEIRPGKYAVVVNTPIRTISWYGAYIACRSHVKGASLFTVDNADDSEWIGRRINFEKNRVTGASKFWVGLLSRSPKGPLFWLSGQNYKTYPEEVQVAGYDDRTKQYAWAVPDGLVTKLKYEFLTVEDEAEAYICQYLKS